jgi:hypothetical protein
VSDLSVRYQNFWAGGEPWDFPIDTNPVTLAHILRFLTGGYVIGARYLHLPGDDAAHIALVQDAVTGENYCAAAFRHYGAVGMPKWESVYFHPRFRVESDDLIQLAIWFPGGNYSRQLDYAGSTAIDHGNIELPGSTELGVTAGLFTYSADLNPNSAFSGSVYGIDVIFRED